MKITRLILLFAAPLISAAQQATFDIQSGGCAIYRGNLYAFGMAGSANYCNLKIYRLEKDLKASDSLSVSLIGQDCHDYVSPYSDTLHGLLNIYLHRKDKSGVTIIRLNDSLVPVAQHFNVEPGRLLDQQGAGRRTLCHGADLYRIMTVSDSGGKQFYLNKDRLETATNAYSPAWQYAFERKHITCAFPFFADSRYVYVFVVVGATAKEGEWILQCDARKGSLVKACKLNPKGETGHYAFGSFLFDKTKRELLLTGQKLAVPGGAQQTVELYALAIDSNLKAGMRQSASYSLALTKQAKKQNGEIMLKFTEATKQAGTLLAECDLYEATGTECYQYKGTNFLQVPLDESKQAAGTIHTSTVVGDFLSTTDLTDLNGKLCGDSVSGRQVLMLEDPFLPVKLYSKSAGGVQSHLLMRSDVRKRATWYALLTGDGRSMKSAIIGNFSRDKRPSLIVTGSSSYVISQDGNDGRLELRAYTW